MVGHFFGVKIKFQYRGLSINQTSVSIISVLTQANLSTYLFFWVSVFANTVRILYSVTLNWCFYLILWQNWQFKGSIWCFYWLLLYEMLCHTVLRSELWHEETIWVSFAPTIWEESCMLAPTGSYCMECYAILFFVLIHDTKKQSEWALRLLYEKSHVCLLLLAPTVWNVMPYWEYSVLRFDFQIQRNVLSELCTYYIWKFSVCSKPGKSQARVLVDLSYRKIEFENPNNWKFWSKFKVSLYRFMVTNGDSDT
jgi:hypothetical protein